MLQIIPDVAEVRDNHVPSARDIAELVRERVVHAADDAQMQVVEREGSD